MKWNPKHIIAFACLAAIATGAWLWFRDPVSSVQEACPIFLHPIDGDTAQLGLAEPSHRLRVRGLQVAPSKSGQYVTVLAVVKLDDGGHGWINALSLKDNTKHLSKLGPFFSEKDEPSQPMFRLPPEPK